MNPRAPAALAIAALVSAPRMADAGPCAPRAELDGDSVAVERVTSELGRLGVTVAAATPECPAVKAVVSLDRAGGIAVAVRDAAQRTEGRVVSDAALAAVWIDSWLRDDLDGWSAPAPRRVAAIEPAASSSPALVPPRDVPPATPGRSVFEQLAISVAYEQAWTDDGSSWSGGNIAACLRVGALCIGGRARAAWQPELTTDISAAARRDLSLLATASLPIDLGNMFIAPELGLGVGQFSTRRIEGCVPVVMPPPCDPMDLMCVMPPPSMCDPASMTDANGFAYVGDELDETSYTPRIVLALRVAIPLFRHVWLDGLASYTLAPLGHRDPYGAPNAPSAFAIPGEPGTGVQLGVGLRVGAP